MIAADNTNSNQAGGAGGASEIDKGGGGAPAGNGGGSVRLPRAILPKRYDIALETDLDQACFKGRVEITIEVLEETSVIVLNSADLDISSAELYLAGQAAAEKTVPPLGASQPLTVGLDAANERVIFTPSEPISPGQYLLNCEYTGVLNDQLKGFYLSTFKDQAGQTQRLGITQFESTNARRAFPCWDEPDFKAAFALKLTVEKDLLAVSSMEAVSETEAKTEGSSDSDAAAATPTAADAPTTAATAPAATVAAKKTVAFASTPIISPYLLAFVVGPLERSAVQVVNTTHGTIPLAIVHPPDQGHLCHFSQQVADFSLKFLTKYFDIAYLGDKLDLIAAPDFAFGAMENVGCVTFREVLLLLDEATSATQEQIRACDVIAHELAHMWFGNLVTMSWWNGIWLKEAFATFMELLVCDAFEPEWKRWELFCLSRAAAMEVDGLHQTRPIEYPVNTPDEAEGMYDLLSYEKGAAVVRMLEQFLTPEIFRDAIRHYLREHAYSNCDTADLWAALEEISAVPVGQTMDSWIYAAGFPLVWVEQLDDTTWRLTQERFCYLPEAKPDEADQAVSTQNWQIPLVLSHNQPPSNANLSRPAQPNPSQPQPAVPRPAQPNLSRLTRHLLMSESSLELSLPADTEWVLPNSGGDSFIRCGYRGANPLQTARDDLTPSERFVLLDDAWALLLSNKFDLAAFLRLLSGFKTETSLAVWTRVLGICQSLRHILPDWAEISAQRWFKALFQPEFERLGGVAENARPDFDTGAPAVPTEPDSDTGKPATPTASNQPEVLARLFGGLTILGGDRHLLDWARSHVGANFKSADLSADIQVEAIRAVASYGQTADFETSLERYANANSPQEKDRYLNALALFPHEAEFARTLELSLSSDVRTQDAPYLLRAALKHRRLGEMAWQFVKQHWGEMSSKFPSNSIGRMLEGVTGLSQMPHDVETFLTMHRVPQAEKMIAQHLEMLKVNAGFRTASQNKLGAWFCVVGGEQPNSRN